MFGCVFATLDTFALTETIDGITWNYYIEDGHAILEYPEIRNTAPHGVRPESANSTNDLPSEINIPAKLGGYEVTHLGAIALQVIPRPASSTARAFVAPMIPALEAE